MSDSVYSQFKATALSEDTLRRQAPSIFAEAPMAGVSRRYTFVPGSEFGRPHSRPSLPLSIIGLTPDTWRPCPRELL